MNAFVPGVIEKIGFYVYLLIDPRNNTIFYAGKGTGSRCFDHLTEAHKTQADSTRDYPKLARIREIEECEQAVRIDVLRHGLTEAEAYLVESAAIDLLGLVQHDHQVDLKTRIGGRDSRDQGLRGTTDINAQYGARSIEIKPDHRVVLIRINRQFKPGMSDEALYEATRKWWKVGHERQRPDQTSAPMWAMAVCFGVVRAVYRIEKWEKPSTEWKRVNPTDAKRWAFLGERDAQMEEQYLFGDVSRYLPASAQNPIRYVNCDPTRNEEKDVRLLRQEILRLRSG